jgi:hypothetical protein
MVCSGFSSQKILLLRPALRDDHITLIIYPADMVMDLRIDEDVIV